MNVMHLRKNLASSYVYGKNEEIKVIQIVYRLAQMSCPLLHGNKKKKTDTENLFSLTPGGFVTVNRID